MLRAPTVPPPWIEATRIAEEQAALRRVATLVAQGVSHDELFAAVNEEVAQLVGAGRTAMCRFEPDDSVTLVAAWSADGVPSPVGARLSLEAALRWIGGAACSICVPIAVDGRAWGVSFAAGPGGAPFPAATEERIAGFTELVGTAIANAQARAELQSLLDEQAALRRVATLVARGASQNEVFASVTAQASRLLGDRPAMLLRRDADGGFTMVSVHGGPARTGAGAVSAPIVVAGQTWGMLAADARHDHATEHRLAQFAELVATAIANAESRTELTASRARIVAAADDSRRRIQRDLHDGAQQRLVHTVISLKLAKASPSPELIDEALRHAECATSELRELVHGIMPATLTRGGLRTGVESLLDRVDLPVHVDIDSARRPAAIETTAYFIVAEALTNAVKHARATSAWVRSAECRGALRIEVRDDGDGGADPARGSGLRGLADRVASCGGTLSVVSPAGRGTVLTATLPLR